MDLHEEVKKVHEHEDETRKYQIYQPANIYFVYNRVEVITDYKDIIYKTSNGNFGNTAHMLQKSGPFGRSSMFSNHLGKAGNYTNDGLNSICDRERYNNKAKDWMATNI